MSIKASVFSVAIAAALIFTASAALAAMKVTSSNVPAYKVGDVIDGKTQLDLPKGGIVRVTDPATNATATFVGAYKGSVADYKTPRNQGGGTQSGGTMGAAPRN